MPKILNFSKDTDFKLSVEAKTQTHAVMELYGAVGGDFFGEGIMAKDVVDRLKNLPSSIKTLDLHINSPGGSVFEGMAIMHRIKQYGQKVKVTAYVDALSASIASVIMLAADKIVMNESGFIMIHKPLAGAYGNSDELEKIITLLDDIENQMITLYAKKTKLSRMEIKDMLTKETWLNSEDAVKMGFADEVLTNNVKVAACLNPSMKWLANVPKALTTKDTLAKQAATDLQNKIDKFLKK